MIYIYIYYHYYYYDDYYYCYVDVNICECICFMTFHPGTYQLPPIILLKKTLYNYYEYLLISHALT